ncbi:MAG: hypothetical protein ACP5RI_03095 [Candidatus Micrarchaeia archaeon]
MLEMFDLYRIDSLPNIEIDKEKIFEVIGKTPFILMYDFATKTDILGIFNKNSSTEIPNQIAKALPGFVLSKIEDESNDQNKIYKILSIYRKIETIKIDVFDDIYNIEVNRGFLSILFIPLSANEIESAKSYLEKTLSRHYSKETKSMQSDSFNRRMNVSIQHDNFADSDEALFLESVLESINSSILKNGIAYNIYFIVDDETGKIEDYIKNRFLILSSIDSRIKAPLDRCFDRINPIPFGINMAKLFLNFRGLSNISYSIKTIYPRSYDGIEIGTYMKDSVLNTDLAIKIKPSSLNLGCIITGLPGSGKTNEAMAIINELIKFGKKRIVIISPTDEWDDFANSHGMYLVRLYDKNTPINFFRCPKDSKIDKFYEDLAMILSSASNAGPYEKPMEKCMLNAFRYIYSKTFTPDPVLVYKEIENSVIKFHAKKTSNGAIYTKHGENIKSALENLRSIISRVEYSSRAGIKIEDMLDNGIVFNLSRISVGTKPYLYALILNQLYAIASTFDVNGDDELRLLICVEEAQLIFRDKESSAVEDLKYRIQDFRKQGIGLMLLTHNVIDIDETIRRLCQIKLYLKQAPDVAPIASSDLIFTYAEDEDIIQKLKHIESRIGALNYIIKKDKQKISQDTIFIKTKEYKNEKSDDNKMLEKYIINNNIRSPKRISMSIKIANNNIVNIDDISVLYLGDEIASAKVKDMQAKFSNLIEGKPYNFKFYSKSRIIAEKELAACKMLNISIQKNKVEIINP